MSVSFVAVSMHIHLAGDDKVDDDGGAPRPEAASVGYRRPPRVDILRQHMSCLQHQPPATAVPGLTP